MKWLARLLAIRLSGVIREGPRDPVGINILVVPANRGAPLEDFAQRLSISLSREEACLLLSSEQTDGLLGSTGISQAAQGSPGDMRLRAWLNQQETQVRYVICVADAELTNWTSRCIRQADEIISIGVAGASPKPTEVEAEVFRQEESGQAKFRKSLVLLHPTANSSPAGTMDWLREREVHRHFHLRAGSPDDLDRVARYVLRREIGLVLSGGGSRGFAHAGIIRAIREAGLPIDLIAGVSMGAIMAAGYAYSDDWVHTVPRLKAQLEGMLSDYTFPFVSLVRGRRFDRCLQALFGDTRIEDLPLPYFCVSSNLTRAKVVVHRTGPLWRAIRASGSLPGLVPPVVENGDLLYDGCLLNNLPLDLMRDEIQSGCSDCGRRGAARGAGPSGERSGEPVGLGHRLEQTEPVCQTGPDARHRLYSAASRCARKHFQPAKTARRQHRRPVSQAAGGRVPDPGLQRCRSSG